MLDIIEFVEDPKLLNDQSLSIAQKMALKVVYGLPLTSDELEVFKHATGLNEYREGREWAEITFILARRSGKSDKLASNIALYEACARKHKFSVGQRGVVMVVASELKRQSRIVFNYILKKLQRSPVLSKMIENVTSEEIFLTNDVSIQVFPCDPRRIRGESLICFIGDETAHWKIQGIRVDVEVLDAARPGLDFPYSKMIKISTPYAMKGEIFDDYKQFYGKANDDVLVFQGSTELFNPSYSKRKLERMKKRKPGLYETEYLAHFRKDMSSMFDPGIIDASVYDLRPLERPYQSDKEYYCFVDVAGGGGKDSYAIAIGHKEGERVIIDVVRSRQPKFDPHLVTSTFCALAKNYHIHQVHGDKFSGDWASSAWSKASKGTIQYLRSEKTKSELYIESEAAFNTELVELPNKELAINQLKDLIRKSRSGGRDSVDTYSGTSEDEGNVICGCITLLITEGSYERLPPPSFGLVEEVLTPEEKMERQAIHWLTDDNPKKERGEERLGKFIDDNGNVIEDEEDY